MRISDSITLPAELERARAAGELVVFAGAGVSMGPPAELPSFEGLAREVVRGTVPWEEAYRDKLDTYLGRARRQGVAVQARARNILATNRAHNPLHEYLIGLFGDAEHVRLITTNFDAHFTTAAGEVFRGTGIPHYFGPALPPGNEFRGVAYLHGALAQPHHHLVLTDEDFAAAYMAEGWAARFLVRVFTDRTVLFVGYSMTDPLMRYLLHSIPPTGRWYGLWHEESEGPGADHAIQRVAFSTSQTGERFGDLNDGLKQWYRYATASPSDHDRELRMLLRHGPPSSPILADYLRVRLKTPEGQNTFWKNATDVVWFDWAAQEGFLNGLTDAADTDQVTTGWGRWCLFNHSEGDQPPLLRFLRGRPVALQGGFRTEVQFHILRSDPLPARAVLRQFLALLLSQPAEGWRRGHDWEWLLDKLWAAGFVEEIVAVLRMGTRLHLQPMERLYLAYEAEEEELRPLSNRVRTAVDPSALVSFLEKRGPDLAARVPEAFLEIGLQGLTEAYELLDLARGVKADLDWISFGRTSIAPSDQDSVAEAIDVLVVLVRNVLDRWREAGSDRLLQFGERYQQCGHKLLQRLALYAVSQNTSISADDVLAQAVECGWPRDPWVRPEFYQLLATHYSRASEDGRRAFLDQISNDGWWSDSFDERHAHARFSLSKKLMREAPDSPLTKALALAESTAHPEWGESDRDGFLSRVQVGWGGQAPSPIDADRMLQWAPSDALERIKAELAKSGQGEAGHSLLGAVQQAAKGQPEWGAAVLGKALPDTGAASISEAILWALRDQKLPLTEQMRILEIVGQSQFAPGTERPLGAMLKGWADNLGREPDERVLDLLDLAGDALYERTHDLPPGIEGHGWTEAAINHPAGDVAHTWWRVADARDWVDGQFVVTLDEAEKARWMRVARDSESAGAFARPILGMATNRLNAGDAPWSVTEVLSLFDPNLDRERAAQLWDGRLSQPRWSWTLIQDLKPYWLPLFRVSAGLIPHRSDELGDWVALLASRPDESEITLEELHEFVKGGTNEARLAFARAIPQHLDRLSSEARLDAWTRVLRPYWMDRCTSMPLPLAQREVEVMVSWLPALPEAAPEVLEQLVGSPEQNLEHADHLLWSWKQEPSFVEAHPAEAAGLVAFLGERGSISPWMADDAVEVIEKALEHGAPCAIAKGAVEFLVTWSDSAVRLAERLREQC